MEGQPVKIRCCASCAGRQFEKSEDGEKCVKCGAQTILEMEPKEFLEFQKQVKESQG